MRKRPNLFIIGAMKSGTTSLHTYLNTHPSVFMCEPKEPCYFVHPDQLNWDKMRKLQLWGHEERYLQLFKAAGDAEIIGESSTLYAKFPHITDIPQRIAQFNPDARFIYVMRDPIKRTISHYWHEVRQGNEYRDLLTAIKENQLYQDVSNYPMQLDQFYTVFGRDRILTLVFEDMVADTSKVVRQVFEWLGVDSSFEPFNLEEKVHVTPKQFYQKGFFFRMRYTWPWSTLASLVPKRFRQAGLDLLVKQVDQEKGIDASTMEQVLEFLLPRQQEQIQMLSQMLGRDFPQWKTPTAPSRPTDLA